MKQKHFAWELKILFSFNFRPSLQNFINPHEIRQQIENFRPVAREGRRGAAPGLGENEDESFLVEDKKKRPNNQAEEQTNSRKCAKVVDISKFFRLWRLSAPHAINYGYYKVKRDQNFDFLYANVWKALKANIQQFFTEISSWASEVRPPLRKISYTIFVCAPPLTKYWWRAWPRLW